MSLWAKSLLSEGSIRREVLCTSHALSYEGKFLLFEHSYLDTDGGTKSSCFKVGTCLDRYETFVMGQERLDLGSNPIDKCEIGMGLVPVEAHCQVFASIKLFLG